MSSSPARTDDPRTVEEQTHLDLVYARLDRMRATTRKRLAATLRESGGTPQAQSERESYERMYVDDLTKFDAAEHNLYFGRLDLEDGETRRIGRIGILDDDDADTTLLLDWRAPLSRAFYLATPAAPEDVARRRHIRTRNRSVQAVNDELLTAGDASAEDFGHGDVVNESALVAALNTARTGEMTDIVETIQREQDLIIRSTHRGVTVIQGGPGTGKTAVALHRAAYLLYTHREILSRSGILIIGPNSDFLDYIGQVLPSLGESGVLLATIGELFPNVHARADEPRTTREVKGRLAMLDVLKRAVRARESLPRTSIPVTFEGYTVEIDSELIKAARGKARSSRRAHNQAQSVFLRSALDALAARHAATIGSSLLDGSQMLSSSDIADIRADMSRDTEIRATLLDFWPTLTPQDVLRDLFADKAALRKCTPGWSDEERAALHRSPAEDASDLTPADVPLLDELAELIGYGTAEAQAREKEQWRRQLAEAQDALDILTGSAPQDLEDELDPEILMAYDLIDAEQLAARQTQTSRATTAERAYGDRTWTFGHVIVDEAQELSAMAWRMVMRRIPNRWMTIIGDTAQTGDLAGTTSWSEVLTPYVANRWQLRELTVNYRTPAEIMTYAARVLSRVDPGATAPTSLRRNGIEPVAIRTEPRGLAATILETATAPELTGLTGIVVPDAVHPMIAEALDNVTEAPETGADASGEVADPRPRLHTVTTCKGLEFDTTIVVEPAELVDQSPRGFSDLYVALTRSTQRLIVIHSRDLPAELADLPSA